MSIWATSGPSEPLPVYLRVPLSVEQLNDSHGISIVMQVLQMNAWWVQLFWLPSNDGTFAGFWWEHIKFMSNIFRSFFFSATFKILLLSLFYKSIIEFILTNRVFNLSFGRTFLLLWASLEMLWGGSHLVLLIKYWAHVQSNVVHMMSHSASAPLWFEYFFMDYH